MSWLSWQRIGTVAQKSRRAWTALSLSPQLAEILLREKQGGIGAVNDVERTQLRAWEFGRMSRMQNQFYDYQRGYLDADVEEDSLMNAALLLERWNELGGNRTQIFVARFRLRSKRGSKRSINSLPHYGGLSIMPDGVQAKLTCGRSWPN